MMSATTKMQGMPPSGSVRFAGRTGILEMDCHRTNGSVWIGRVLARNFVVRGFFVNSIRAFTTSVVVLSVALSACSSGQDVAEPVVAPAAWYAMMEQAQEDQLRFSVASDLLVAECMRRQGFEYESSVSSIEYSGRLSSDGFSGLIRADFDSWEPTENGYRQNVDDGETVGGGLPSGGGSDEAYTQAWYDALFGSSSAGDLYEADFGIAGVSANKTGCIGEATTLLGGQEAFELSAIASAMSLLRSDVDIRVEADDRLIDSITQWSGCMADEGYRSTEGTAYSDPDQARNENLLEEEPDDAEMRIASADKRCQVSTGYIDVVVEVYRDYERQMLSQPEAEAVVLKWHEIGNEPRIRIENVLAENLLTS
jgi:hypothetical protein